MSKFLAALVFLGLNAYVYNVFATNDVIPPRSTTFASFPDRLGDWRCPHRERMERGVEKRLEVTDYLLCTFVNPERSLPVNVYVGYHQAQVRRQGGADSSMIHPPEHCLPGSGWDVIGSQVVPIDLPGLPGAHREVKRFVIAHGDLRQLVYFWYQSRGRIIAHNTDVILYRFWDHATRGRTDGALVRLTIPIPPQGVQASEDTFRDFAPRLTALLPKYLPE